jgi:uncharacterized protein YdaU (DUF1376 family)
LHFYPFNIKDWALHTSHLTLEEEGAYRRLLDMYYDTERPIPTETQPVIRRLRLGSYIHEVEQVLSEFFDLEEDGYHNNRADIEIHDYQNRVSSARKNGKKGGRPRKDKGVKTQPVNSANPKITEPITNQELEPVTRTSNQVIKMSPKAPVDFSILGMSEFQISELKRIRKANKGGVISQRVANALGKEFKQATALGHSVDDLLTEWETRGWKSFKSEWMSGNTGLFNNQPAPRPRKALVHE